MQMYEFFTYQRYQYVCMFVDHHCDFTYVRLLKYQIWDESVEAKESFEGYAESHGVEIKHYHANKIIFGSSQWMNHCKDMHQGLTFYGVYFPCQIGWA